VSWKNRIIEHREINPEQLLAHPRNHRIHPGAQAKALNALLDDVGWVGEVIVNIATDTVIDGHLRVAEAISKGEPTVPCAFVDLTEEEERKVLATLDAICDLAIVDEAALARNVADLELAEPLQAMIDDILSDGSAKGAGGAHPEADETVPDAEDAVTWGYATFGKTKVGCSTAEVDALDKLLERYKDDNGGLDVGFVRWLAGTDR